MSGILPFGAVDPTGANAASASDVQSRMGITADGAAPNRPHRPPDESGAARPHGERADGPPVPVVLGAAAAGAAVAIALGVYGRVHDPTGQTVWTYGFSDVLAMKAWVGTIAALLVVCQVATALWMWGRLPVVGAPPIWLGGLHRWTGTAAFIATLPVAYHCLWSLGFQTTTARVAVHATVGCAFYGAFTTKLLVLRSDRIPFAPCRWWVACSPQSWSRSGGRPRGGTSRPSVSRERDAMALRFTPTLAVCAAGALITAVALARPGNSDEGGDPYGVDTGPAASVAADPVDDRGTATIVIAGFDFTPGVSVPAGGRVEVTNTDGAPHTLTARSGEFDTGRLGTDESATITVPSTPGTYEFFCAVHPTMVGTLSVSG